MIERKSWTVTHYKEARTYRVVCGQCGWAVELEKDPNALPEHRCLPGERIAELQMRIAELEDFINRNVRPYPERCSVCGKSRREHTGLIDHAWNNEDAYDEDESGHPGLHDEPT